MNCQFWVTSYVVTISILALMILQQESACLTMEAITMLVLPCLQFLGTLNKNDRNSKKAACMAGNIMKDVERRMQNRQKQDNHGTEVKYGCYYWQMHYCTFTYLNLSRGHWNRISLSVCCSFLSPTFCKSRGTLKLIRMSLCLSVTKTWTWLISFEVLMIEHWYLICMIIVTYPFY